MKRHEVKLSQDHLKRQARCSPETAIEELVWNGLDAGGNRVDVDFEENSLGGIEAIEIRDWGTGIPFVDVPRAFGTIGKSLKLERKKTKEGRVLHGSEGRGRFKALVLGNRAVWATTYQQDGSAYSYEIRISADTQDTYQTSEEPAPTDSRGTGTLVRIEGVDHPSGKLRGTDAAQSLTEHFALYLKNYPSVEIRYDGYRLDPRPLIAHFTEYDLEPTENSTFPAQLAIIEWNIRLPNKKLLYADMDGFCYHESLPMIHFPEVAYTAYVKFAQAREWAEEERYLLADLDDDLRNLAERAKERLREHIRQRLAENAQGVVEEWKKENIYPYPKDEPRTVVERAERQVFDIVASRVHRFHKPFRHGERESRQLTLRLVRQALETNPTSLRQILEEVLRLPRAQQDELAQLLQSTTLPGIIRGSLGRCVNEEQAA